MGMTKKNSEFENRPIEAIQSEQHQRKNKYGVKTDKAPERCRKTPKMVVLVALEFQKQRRKSTVHKII